MTIEQRAKKIREGLATAHKEADQLRAEADAALARMMKKRRQADSRAAVWTVVLVMASLLAVLGMSALIATTQKDLIANNPEMALPLLSVVTFSH
jgi:type VI protein secretion system component VasF